ncbi:GyrI-like domain-containing protein [Actinoplanes sp. TRM 88003]|uniref:GyrI-like domain-containing protein n=1 Tax=Paractinoplanes aksuensis TaxID=2939490 RepID=A0ABT1E0A0_9ACTN|nr:GyrI-like domain-containing protein [Actinoplanes aksuensis]MCO8276560.1 GyrI-like domain-containing protein [Actinoplanes aksuensis]
MVKTDFKKEIGVYRAPKGAFEIVDVPELQYLMIDGHGDPNSSPDFARATEALYPLAYKLKFASKQKLERDYVVMPLEGLWWADDMDAFTTARDKSQWDWTLLIMTPDWIDEAMFTQAVEQVTAKNAPERLPDVRLAPLAEGRCVQTLHVGSFDDEAETLARLHNEFVPSHGLTMTGRHHEIYLSDPRKTAPEKQRTILRQPVSAQ